MAIASYNNPEKEQKGMTITIHQSRSLYALISNQDLLLLQNYNRLKAAIAAAAAGDSCSDSRSSSGLAIY